MADTTTPQRITPDEDALLDELDALEASGESFTAPPTLPSPAAAPNQPGTTRAPEATSWAKIPAGEDALLDELDALEAAGESFTSLAAKSSGALFTAGKVAKDSGGGILEIPGQVNRGVASAINETSGAMYGLVTQPAVKWIS